MKKSFLLLLLSVSCYCFANTYTSTSSKIPNQIPLFIYAKPDSVPICKVNSSSKFVKLTVTKKPIGGDRTLFLMDLDQLTSQQQKELNNISCVFKQGKDNLQCEGSYVMHAGFECKVGS